MVRKEEKKKINNLRMDVIRSPREFIWRTIYLEEKEKPWPVTNLKAN